jgi:SH3-like domain-containing protein
MVEMMKKSPFLRIMLACLAVMAIHAPVMGQTPRDLGPNDFKAYAPSTSSSRISEFSGLPVPRYSSLRYDRVNGRSGPSLDYPVSWTYERVGLPVVIVRESQEWRKIRDPQGDEVWVHRRMLAGERTAITTSQGAIYRNPDSRTIALATYKAGAVMALGDCTRDWCRVEAEGRKGWVQKVQLWGADELKAATPTG